MKLKHKEGFGKHTHADGTVTKEGDVVDVTKEEASRLPKDKFEAVVDAPKEATKEAPKAEGKPETK